METPGLLRAALGIGVYPGGSHTFLDKGPHAPARALIRCWGYNPAVVFLSGSGRSHWVRPGSDNKSVVRDSR
jgi:hypothetical protein